MYSAVFCDIGAWGFCVTKLSRKWRGML